MSYTVRIDKKNIIVNLQGKKLEDMFGEGALAVFHTLYDTDSIRGAERIRFVVRAKDLSKLFHEWITNLLERAEIQNLSCGEFRVSSIQKIGDSEYLLTGMAYGEPFDSVKHGDKKIKTISHISVEFQKNGECSCEVTITLA